MMLPGDEKKREWIEVDDGNEDVLICHADKTPILTFHEAGFTRMGLNHSDAKAVMEVLDMMLCTAVRAINEGKDAARELLAAEDPAGLGAVTEALATAPVLTEDEGEEHA